MIKRYYYNCPIITAYMAKYHGVKYSPIPSFMTYSFLNEDVSSDGLPYYIESVELLKPKEGDFAGVVKFINGKWCRLTENGPESINLDITIHTDTRDNMPFFIPYEEN